MISRERESRRRIEQKQFYLQTDRKTERLLTLCRILAERQQFVDSQHDKVTLKESLKLESSK